MDETTLAADKIANSLGAHVEQPSSSPWEMKVTGRSNQAPVGSVDWIDLKRRIIASLGPDGVYKAYVDLGVRFTGPYNSKGKAECHVIDRPDETPSAFVDVRNGVYHSSGNTSETLNLFDFALKHGGAKFGDWLGTVKHYAEQVGIEVGVRKDSKGRILEATYDYTDAAENLLYQVIRYRLASGKKTFNQRRPDGKGDWVYDLDGVTRVLYGLPAIQANPKYDVFIVEGEKDADRLNALLKERDIPAVATSACGGADDTGRWETIYAETLRGRRCLVIADNDPSGLRHARGVCKALHGIAESVKLLELPGVGAKGDVSDWLDQGHTLDDLWVLVVDAVPFDPTVEPPKPAAGARKHTVPLREVKDEDVDWFYEDRIAPGFITIFAGRTGFGKSFVTCDIVARLSRGRCPPFSVVKHDPMNVLFISEDSPSIVIGPRLRRLGADPDRVHFMKWDSLAGYTLSDTDMLEEAYLECGEPRVVIIDPPSSFLGDIDEHHNAEVRGVCKLLIAWLEKHRVACILITHVNKAIGKGLDAVERIIGSIAWGTSARMTLAFVKDPDIPDQWVFGGTKNNLGQLAETLAYRFAKAPEGVTIEWIGKTETTIENAMNNISKKTRGQCATEWLAARFKEKTEWESDELKKMAHEAGISKNALWSPEVNGLPIEKKKRINASGDSFWVWRSLNGWPNVNGKNGEVGKDHVAY